MYVLSLLNLLSQLSSSILILICNQFDRLMARKAADGAAGADSDDEADGFSPEPISAVNAQPSSSSSRSRFPQTTVSPETRAALVSQLPIDPSAQISPTVQGRRKSTPKLQIVRPGTSNDFILPQLSPAPLSV
jgi:hypothetical protein